MTKPSLTPADRKHREEFATFSIKHGHEAYRAVLESLYALWEGWNRDHFGGRLVKPHILLAEPKSPRALGDHSNISGWGSKNQIRIRPSVLDGSHPQVRAGELHETIHQHHDEITGLVERGYHGHGPAFRDECNRIGRELGLPPVRTAKARGPGKELPSCAHWPFNVRPEGYYRGAFDVGEEAKEQGKETEHDGEPEGEKPAAKAEDLAKFLSAAIEQFEQRFDIAAEEKLEAIRRVVKGMKPGRGGSR